MADETSERLKIAAHWIQFHEREYARDKNPVHVWRAYLEARGAHLPIPPWVLRYLDAAARTFCSWARAEGHVPPDLPVAIAKALGMLRPRGRSSVFEADGLGIALAGLVDQDMRNPRGPQKLYLSWEHVAKVSGHSVSAVRRAWNRHKDRFSAS